MFTYIWLKGAIASVYCDYFVCVLGSKIVKIYRCLSFFFWPLCCLVLLLLAIVLSVLLLAIVFSVLLLAIVLSVLRFTDSDYPFGIFKFFFVSFDNL